MCWYCGSPVVEAEPIGRSFRCGVCGKDLRVCRHCKFFLPKSHECAESGVENVSDKERANFCDWFALDPKFRSASAASSAASDSTTARVAFDNLFT
ncbi:MAG: hypothetical protein LBL45_03235 [Treponema sp.]|jgi:hypothetical protein|nr:hypothetical protein [Treponema sp.]